MENIVSLNTKVKMKLLKKILLAASFFLTPYLHAFLGYGGNIHNKNPALQENVRVFVTSSNPSQSPEIDFTDEYGGWGVSLLNSNPGDIVYAEFRKVDDNGVVWKARTKDIGDGLGEMPDVWMYDSLKAAQNPDSIIRTFNVWRVIDTSGYYVTAPGAFGDQDTTLYMTATINNKNIKQDTMRLDVTNPYDLGFLYEWRNGQWEIQPHYYNVYYPIYGLQPNDTFNIFIFKKKPFQVNGETAADTVYRTTLTGLVYDTTDFWEGGTYFGDAYVWTLGSGPQQYDTLYFPQQINVEDNYMPIVDSALYYYQWTWGGPDTSYWMPFSNPDTVNMRRLSPHIVRIQTHDAGNYSPLELKLLLETKFYDSYGNDTTLYDTFNVDSTSTSNPNEYWFNASFPSPLLPPWAGYYYPHMYAEIRDTAGNTTYTDTLIFRINPATDVEENQNAIHKLIPLNTVMSMVEVNSVIKVLRQSGFKVGVYDPTGRRINLSGQRQRIGTGLYFLEVRGKDYSRIAKIIILR